MTPPEYLKLTGCLARLWVLARYCLAPTVPAQDNPVTVRDENSPEPSASRKKLTQFSLEELTSIQVDTVYGASKHEQKVTEATSVSSILSAEEIKQQGDRTLGDRHRSGRGTYVTCDRAENAIGWRGANRSVNMSGFWLANATLFSQEIAKGSDGSGIVYNLFSQFYREPASGDFRHNTTRQDGWQCRIKATWKFKLPS